MDLVALEKAFEMHSEVKFVVSAELYGFPGRMDEIKRICEKHGALLIENAAEAMGATIDGRQCGSFGDYSAISYNGNKIITGSAGGCLLTNDLEIANTARKWSTQARENAPLPNVQCNCRCCTWSVSTFRGTHRTEKVSLRTLQERFQELACSDESYYRWDRAELLAVCDDY